MATQFLVRSLPHSWQTLKCQFLLTQGLAPPTRRVYLSAPRRYFAFCRQHGSKSFLSGPWQQKLLVRSLPHSWQTRKCQFLLTQGLAPPTRRVNLSAPRRYFAFCRQDGRTNVDGSLPPADEETTVLAVSLHHSSIKVYLAAVCSLHIDYGFPDPLLNCLRAQHLLKGIKQVQAVTPQRLPITIDHLRAIQRSLELSTRDHIMLWIACCLGFFAFLRAGQFTVNALFQPSIHMAVGDLQADALVNPTCFKVHVKGSKTNPFHVGCDIYLGHTEGSVCLIRALGS